VRHHLQLRSKVIHHHSHKAGCRHRFRIPETDSREIQHRENWLQLIENQTVRKSERTSVFLKSITSDSTGREIVKDTDTPAWISITLRLAGIYNLLWGLWVVIVPETSLRVCGYPEHIAYPQLWQCIGMIVGVYGVGYWIAAGNPVRHWVIVFVGLLGKLLGPLGFAISYAQGALPWSAGRLCLFNDLIWWIPFALILEHVARQEPVFSTIPRLSYSEAIGKIRSNTGQTLGELSANRRLLVVFLRHAGCSFCRQALSDVAAKRAEIEKSGTSIAFVHMSSDERARHLFRKDRLEDLPRFSDPDQLLYRAFELKNGSFSQLLGPAVLWKGIHAAVFQGHGVGMLDGNGWRLPGVFLLKDGQILAANRLQTAAKRPDYESLCQTSFVNE